VAVGTTALWIYFCRLEQYVTTDILQLRPQAREWKRLLNLGLPAGGEMALMFLSTAVIYWAIRDFGASAQAGFGAGFRVMQGMLLPAMAIAFAAGPITGQNFGAGDAPRVVQTFRVAAVASTIAMAAITLLLQRYAQPLVEFFTSDREAARVAAVFLHLSSLGFVARGLILSCSSSFQGLGNTRPALVSSAASLLIFSVCALWLSRQPDFRIEQLWYVSLGTLVAQATLSLLLLRAEFERRLAPLRVARGNLSLSAE
jgi:Na+-driven multidrug efflux pump